MNILNDAPAEPSGVEFLKDLPSSCKKRLREILDKENNWEHLVQKVRDKESNLLSVDELKQEKYPGHVLLQLLESSNFTVTDVYETAAAIKLFEVMKCLDGFVRTDLNDRSKRVYDLPEEIRAQLCALLDDEDRWKYLHARFFDHGVGFPEMFLFELPSIESPSNEFLKVLKDRNYTVELLYIALASLDLPQTMSLLEKFVPVELKDAMRSALRKNKERNIADASLGTTSVNQAGSLMSGSAYQDRPSNHGSEFQNLPAENNPNKSTYSSRGEIKMSYEELSKATEGWSDASRLHKERQGSFYQGLWNGQTVAIKKLQPKESIHYEIFKEEVSLLCSATHEKMLKMLMFYEGSGNPCLIYPWMRNGSLNDYLLHEFNVAGNGNADSSQREPLLDLEKKLKIALGVTQALCYLQEHFKKEVVVKSSDIMLSESMDPLVADVCLPCTIAEPSEQLALYLPLPYDRSQRLDLFCIGTILLELHEGKPADRFTEHPLLVSKKLFDECNQTKVEVVSQNVVSLVYVCHHESSFWKKNTNHMESVCKMLEYIRTLY